MADDITDFERLMARRHDEAGPKSKVAVLANWKSRLPPDRDQVVVLFLTRFCTGLQHRSPRDAEADHVSPSLREIEEVRVK